MHNESQSVLFCDEDEVVSTQSSPAKTKKLICSCILKIQTPAYKSSFLILD